jgi:hypothetical protein
MLQKLIRRGIKEELKTLVEREGEAVVQKLLGNENTELLKPKL